MLDVKLSFIDGATRFALAPQHGHNEMVATCPDDAVDPAWRRHSFPPHQHEQASRALDGGSAVDLFVSVTPFVSVLTGR